MDWQPLLSAARSARGVAYAPYSRFFVGAALLAEDGRVFAGANVENRSFGLALCAERAAVAAAVAAGCQRYRALLVLTDADPPAPPCGLCRETLAEFCGPDLEIRLVGRDDAHRDFRLGELFPEPFRFEPRN
ncbi:MAG: cytidine deaminase [Holophagales bacterium]|nr:cytidine deaminase [Holophagales bacterium]